MNSYEVCTDWKAKVIHAGGVLLKNMSTPRTSSLIGASRDEDPTVPGAKSKDQPQGKVKVKGTPMDGRLEQMTMVTDRLNVSRRWTSKEPKAPHSNRCPRCLTVDRYERLTDLVISFWGCNECGHRWNGRYLSDGEVVEMKVRVLAWALNDLRQMEQDLVAVV